MQAENKLKKKNSKGHLHILVPNSGFSSQETTLNIAKTTYHSLPALTPSKKARCPPLGVVANTMFLFALNQ
jgi:hypothetical protein